MFHGQIKLWKILLAFGNESSSLLQKEDSWFGDTGMNSIFMRNRKTEEHREREREREGQNCKVARHKGKALALVITLVI